MRPTDNKEGNSLLRVGRISERDPDKARVRVAFSADGVTTGWLQTLHNGANGVSWFHTYAINELVAVVMESDGVYGFVLGAVYSGSDVPTEAGEEVTSVVFPNGNKVVYNNQTGEMEIKASGGVKITGDLTVTGSVDASGDVTAGALNISLVNHTHQVIVSGNPETATTQPPLP